MAMRTRARSARRWRIPSTVRLRTLLLFVLAVAAGLGYWNYLRRRAAVDRLLAVVPTGILLEVGPTSPGKDPTHEPDRGRYITELRRIRESHADSLAVSHLGEALRVARLRGDEKSMRGALAALQWLAPSSREALSQIIPTARGDIFPLSDDQGEVQIRTLAIHVLGLLATEDDRALAALIAILEGPDRSFQRFLSASAANELGGLGPRASGAILSLIEASEPRDPVDRYDLLPSCSIRALGRLGKHARAAIPKLIAIARDRGDDRRREAISALGEIGNSIRVPRLSAPFLWKGKPEAPEVVQVIEGLESQLLDSDRTMRELIEGELLRLGRRAGPKSRLRDAPGSSQP